MMKTNKEKIIVFTKEQEEEIIPTLQTYLEEKFEIEVGSLQCQFFLDFITENIGAYYYNKGIDDSMTFMTQKVEDMVLLFETKE